MLRNCTHALTEHFIFWKNVALFKSGKWKKKTKAKKPRCTLLTSLERSHCLNMHYLFNPRAAPWGVCFVNPILEVRTRRARESIRPSVLTQVVGGRAEV